MLQGMSKIEEGFRRNQRQAARVALAALIGVLAVSIALPAGGQFGAIAQEASPTPTETETASPTPTSTLPAGPQIMWLNPEDGTSVVLSTKQDVDELYHLVAWVFEVPSDPAVQFQVQEGEDTITIGEATRAGTTDAWELDWDLGGRSDGAYILHAVLFQGGTEIDRHEMEVVINDEDGALPLPEPDDQAEKAAITYPENGEGLGYFTNASGVTRFVVDGVVSADTTSVELFYTASVPGTDPEWTSCGTTGPESDPPPGMTAAPEGSQYVRMSCTVDEETDPASISAVALVPNSTPEALEFPEFVGAADGHRVLPYAQVPATINITPQQHTVAPAEGGGFGCSENIAATLLDQEGRLINGAKVDVHAAGPTNLLRFATNTGGSTGRSANQPPQQGNHQNQAGWHCADEEASGDQGFHGRLDEPDVKHIQTVPAGTDRHGRFVFALWSDAPGGTQFTVWADTDNDDLFCAEEVNGDGSIGWAEGAPAVIGLGADVEGPCPGPSPTPTQTQGPVVESGPCEGHPQNSRTPRDGGGMVIVGTQGDDILEGTDEGDLICGLGGKDDIRGRSGHDELHGGRGADTIRGGSGQDFIKGNGGHDTLSGNKGHDVVKGNRGNDIIRAGRHNDVAAGGKGHDTLRAGRGHDKVRGNRGNDELHGGRGNDNLNGGPGSDLCRGGRGADSFNNCET